MHTVRDRPDCTSEQQLPAAFSYKYIIASLHVQFDNVATELTRRESELFTLRAKLETAEKQAADCVQHVTVLKEQLRTRDSKVTTLSADVRSTCPLS